VCFVVYKTTSEQECAILTTLYLIDTKNTDKYKSNVLNDTTLKLKTSECSSVIVFKNLSRVVSLYVFHSWLLFTLIVCWLAISEEMSLKFIYLLSLKQIP
jgi:hypothetical protein